MRAIKFRAWDGENMHPSENVVIYLSSGFIEKSSFDSGSIHLEETDVKSVMQYTGLLDKNGVEIYEGDIVEALGIDGGEVLGDVQYSEGEYQVNNTIHSFPEWPCASVAVLCQFKVIGNIHENPELLEAT